MTSERKLLSERFRLSWVARRAALNQQITRATAKNKDQVGEGFAVFRRVVLIRSSE